MFCRACGGLNNDDLSDLCPPCESARRRRLEAGECIDCGAPDGEHVEGGCRFWRDYAEGPIAEPLPCCALCGEPLTPDERDVHAECAESADPDRGKRCSRCGCNPYTCPCTTGWDPARGMLW